MRLKKCLLPVTLLMVSSISFQSCIGSFSLTNKVLAWNKNVSNKFVNELVFFAFWVLPVYEVSAIADLLVINSIEFWSGNKPLEANNQVISTEHGDYYIAVFSEGYKVVSPDGTVTCFNFDCASQTWSFGVEGNEMTEFLRFVDSDNVQILTPEGVFVDVELTREGIENFKAELSPIMLAAN